MARAGKGRRYRWIVGKYERSAIELLETGFGERWIRDDSRVFSFGPDAGTGEVDGVIDGRLAVEIGVGSTKQIRASVLDLIFHPLPGKLLVLVDTPGHTTERSVVQTATILARAGCSGVVFRVPSSGGEEKLSADLSEIVTEWIGETEKNVNQVWAFRPRQFPVVIDAEKRFGEDRSV